MSGQDLLIELQEKSKLLDTALRSLGNRGRAKSQAEHDYRVALSQEILIERDKGTPVTIINDICKGKKQIAKLRFDRDVAVTMYETAKEACNVYKIQVNLLREQIDREYRG
jgi:hypothetical protein